MATRKLDKAEWRVFLDRISKALIGKHVEIEVASRALGDQIEAEWLPLLGTGYDPKDDIVEIALEGVHHLINKPQEIYVDLGPASVSSLEIIDSQGVRHIMKLRDPLMLPASSPAAG